MGEICSNFVMSCVCHLLDGLLQTRYQTPHCLTLISCHIYDNCKLAYEFKEGVASYGLIRLSPFSFSIVVFFLFSSFSQLSSLAAHCSEP